MTTTTSVRQQQSASHHANANEMNLHWYSAQMRNSRRLWLIVNDYFCISPSLSKQNKTARGNRGSLREINKRNNSNHIMKIARQQVVASASILLLLLAISLNFDSITCASHRQNENRNLPLHLQNHHQSPPSMPTTANTRHKVKPKNHSHQDQNHHISVVAPQPPLLLPLPSPRNIDANHHRQLQSQQLHSSSPKKNIKLERPQAKGSSKSKSIGKSSVSPKTSNNRKLIETTINAFDFDHSRSNLQLEKILALAANAAVVSINQSASDATSPSVSSSSPSSPLSSSSSSSSTAAAAYMASSPNLIDQREREVERDSVSINMSNNQNKTSQGSAPKQPPAVDPRELVKSLRSINKERKSLSYASGYPGLDVHQRAIEQEIQQTFNDFDSHNFLPPTQSLMPNETVTTTLSTSTGNTIDENGFAGAAAALEATEETPIMGLRSQVSTNNDTRLPQILSQRAHLAEQHAILHDFEAPYQGSGEQHALEYSDSPSTGVGRYGNGKFALRSSVHDADQSSPPLNPLSNYLPGDHESRSPVGFATDGRPPNNIRVVFNNNPQFIIGREAATGHLDSPSSGKSNYAYKSRSPTGGGRGDVYYNEDYHGDESRIDETKVRETKVEAAGDHKTPCDKGRQEEFGPNLEQIDLSQQTDSLSPPAITKTQAIPTQQQQQLEVQAPIRQTIVQQPETVTQQRQVIEQEPQFQVKSPLDEQVITPFDQIVKSGIRPPLRMVISMRNKNGDLMKVPINLQGSKKQTQIQQPVQSQMPAIDLGPQMQIHFEPPVMEKAVVSQLPVQMQAPIQEQISVQQPEIRQRPAVDENTPIGGDVFDPSIVKPFARKTSTKTRKESPMSKWVNQLKSIALPQQLDEDDGQQQQQEDNISDEPRVREKLAPLVPKQTKQQQPQPPFVTQTTAPPPLLPVPPQMIPEQQKQVQPTPPSLKQPPPIKAEPSPPVSQQALVSESPPPIKTQLAVDSQQELPPTIIKQEPQQTQTPEVPVNNKIPPGSQVSTIGGGIAESKTDCHDGEKQRHQQQDDIDAMNLAPISMNADGDGVVQMMMPKLTSLHNKTFATMFAQFQKALNEQMQVHQLISNNKSPQEQQQEQQQNFQEQQRQTKQLQQQLQQDEQEDLMVAMMAANLNKDGEGKSNGDQGMTMTVIRPPKGTSIQDAIAAHARNSSDPTRAVAILHSIQNKVKRPEVSPKDFIGPQADSSPHAIDQMSSRGQIDFIQAQPPAQPVNINLRPGGNPLPPNAQPPASEEPADPDGFSSEVSFSHRFQDQHSRQQKRQADGTRGPMEEQRGRFKRDAISGYNHHQLISMMGEQQVEPADRLRGKAGSVLREKKPAARQQEQKPEAILNVAKSSKNVDAAKKEAAKKSEPPSEIPKRKDELAPSYQQGKGKQPLFHGRGRDTIDAAASQQNEVSDDDEPSEEDSEASDSNQDESSSSPSGSSDGSDLMDDESNDFSDDSDDPSAFSDSDDEPYNQGASSERDYNNPTSFDIPQIDINPDTLKQKGCKTVLREVQEIPLNGLGVVRADGQPGSGYNQESGSAPLGRRVRRQANNENLINSRKVTSIVMTKECHFPNDSQSVAGESSSGNRNKKPNTSLAPGQYRPPLSRQPYRQKQVVATASPPLSSSIGSSPAESSMLNPQLGSLQQHQQQQQLYNSQILRPSMATNLVYRPQTQAAYATYKRIDPKLAANFYNLATNDNQVNQHSNKDSNHLYHQQQQPTEHFQMLSSAQTPSGQYPMPTTGTKVTGKSVEQQASKQQPHPQSQTQQKQQQSRPMMQSAIVQPMSGQVQQPQVSPIRRRSAPTVMPVMSFRSGLVHANDEKRMPMASRVKGKDIYIGADSRRNEVVARKLYKPPSEDDPYHTLSYSSQTGVDPDMDQDEDDSFVMGPDDKQESASSGNNQHRQRPEATAARSRKAELQPPRMRETLSEDERMALMDPNHEDTDPVQRPRGSSSSGSYNNIKRNANRLRQAVERQSQADRDSSDDADESDSDLAEETKQREATINNLSSQIKRRQDQLKSSQMRSPNLRLSSAIAKMQPNKHQSQVRPHHLDNQQHKRNYQTNQRQQRRVSPAIALQDQLDRNQPRYQLGDSGSEGESQEEEPQRFGRSFKFEHKVGRPEAHGLAAQLRGLQPGRQGFVSMIEGDEGRERVVRFGPAAAVKATGGRATIKPRQSGGGTKGAPSGGSGVGQVATTNHRPQVASKRQDEQEGPGGDPDENDEGDDDDEDDGPRNSAAASSRRDIGSDGGGSGGDSEDPDSDPDYNPKESQIPATKPKRLQKSFAYVHRDLPKKGSKNPDDFEISYGKGDIQTEQEDYDSDREHPSNNNNNNNQQANEQVAAAASTVRASGPTRTMAKQQPRVGGGAQISRQSHYGAHQATSNRAQPAATAQQVRFNAPATSGRQRSSTEHFVDQDVAKKVKQPVVIGSRRQTVN